MNRQGFTFIEIAVVLAVAGLVTSAGLILLPKLWHEKQRVETQKYLHAAKAALLTHAANYNALPLPDNTDLLPTDTLKLKQKDSFDHSVRYMVNSNLLVNTASGVPCSTLKNYFKDGTMTGFPLLWQHGMLEEKDSSVAVAAVLISRGIDGEFDRRWVDDDGDGVIDAGESVIGDNSTDVLTVNFVQTPVSSTFDDLVVYLTIPEVMNALPECRQ